jgi:predicted dienelactone hydrolase
MIPRSLQRALAAAVFAAGVASSPEASSAADPLADVVPLAQPGRFPVACSNVAQDFARVPAGESAEGFWRGLPAGGRARYVSDLLSDPANSLVSTFVVPNDSALFAGYEGRTVTSVNLICYPTSATNGRQDYPLPNGKSVPKMQRGAEAPVFPDGTSRLPLLVYSHGYGGSPLSGSYFDALLLLASNGYIVAAPFHGDFRYSALGPDSWDGVTFRGPIPVWDDFVAMQAVRPLALSAMLDTLLAHPYWRDRIDTARIGGFGVSQGGESMLLMAGAQLTESPTGAAKRVTLDTRLKAAVGYVPYFGTNNIPAFGAEQRGLDGVALPFLGISGTSDPIAPENQVERGMQRLGSTRVMVNIAEMGHDLTPRYPQDIYTWTLVFLAATVGADANALAQLQRMERVTGGADDFVKLGYVAPAPAVGDERITVEYYNASLDHYFITAEPAEMSALDNGSPPGWTRTGYEFKTWARSSSIGVPACRFFGTPGIGPNSHFFTIDPVECEGVKQQPAWTYEGLAFNAVQPGPTVCAPGQTVVTRLYNNGKGGQGNHRYLTGPTERERMLGQGWVSEGPRLCAAP